MWKNGDMFTFKIHDLMHDIAQQALGKEIFVADSTTMDLDKKTRHLYDIAPCVCTKCFIITTTAKIHSYAKDRGGRFIEFQFPVRALLVNWRSLRVFDLRWLNIPDSPNAIVGLLNLRGLNLSCCQELKMLPKSLTKLINLQFLYLNRCYKLEELLEDFSKLVNLRTLFIFHAVGFSEDYRGGLRYMPLGMKKMECSRVSLEDLRVPRNLRASLEIYIGLGPDYNHSKEYGRAGGYLCNTKYLKSVSIKWPRKYKEERMGNDDDDDVLEDLHPHSNLKE
ncbi:hypothetical protein Cgig2_018430 [Carnegiea gigantea]|uniref:Uncharacterized protein n=1 Tax=Carnegiea gigantea TaxID=171969 RepID=A0A9Q1QEF9_9CARY|nr:hypothetical protein Cgig2_018430 [Carnegiea gigantea]